MLSWKLSLQRGPYRACQWWRLVMLYLCTGHRYDNFIVGLMNVSPNISTPTLNTYTLCGQYAGAVPAPATVSLYCHDNLPPFRYVIVQIPLTVHFIACEIEVLVRGTRVSNINILIFTTHSLNTCVTRHMRCHSCECASSLLFRISIRAKNKAKWWA